MAWVLLEGTRMRLSPTVLMACLALSAIPGCGANPIQLASAYDAAVDSQAQALETDFLTFAGERQQTAGTPAGAYANYAKSYSAFDVRLAVISLRAASDPGGTTCGDAIKIADQAATGSGLANAIAANAVDVSGKQSCVVLEVAQLQKQFRSLQAADMSRCQTGMGACTILFPPGSVDDFLPNVNSGKAPLVRAVMVSIESLVGFEQDLKPAAKS